MKLARFAPPAALAVLLFAAGCGSEPAPHAWSAEELALLRSLSLDSLPPLPPDPSNAVADDPRAADLGQRLFFDTRLSANGEVSCATCHRPELLFTDGKPRSEAIGTTRRHAPTVIGAAYSPWLFWDGRKDTQWSQTLSPLEDPAEHGGTRTAYAEVVARRYREPYEALFGALPPLGDTARFPPRAGPAGDAEQRAAWESMTETDRVAVNRVFANIGKAIAAYERTLLHGPSPFDRYVRAALAGDPEAMRAELSDDEAAGLRLFVGRAQCTDCHFGPLLTNHDFHNTGLPPDRDRPLDEGRIAGAALVLADPFNCMSEYSDAGEGDCAELRFIKTQGDELIGALRTPSLRNVAETAPYMHDGRFATLAEVLRHYDEAPEPVVGHSDLEPLGLTDAELKSLEAFLRKLGGPVAAPPGRLAPLPG